MELKFYRCPVCGNVVVKLKDAKTPLTCCGKQMQRLIVKTEDSLGKHVPDLECYDRIMRVKVGDLTHPMIDKHRIEWVTFQTNFGFQVHYFKDGEYPKTDFYLALAGEKPVAIYAYCNLHGLYKYEITSWWF